MKQNIKGFTLIELIMHIGLFSILLLVMTQIFTWILDIQAESQATSFIYQDGQYIINRISFDIQRAENIILPTTNGQQENNLELNIDGTTYTYAIINNNITINNILGTDVLNSSNTNISNLIFKKVGNTNGKDTVSLSFTITSNIRRPAGYQTKNFQTTAGMR